MKNSLLILAILSGLGIILVLLGYVWLNSFRYVPGVTVRNWLDSAGVRRQFLLHVPVSYKAGEPLPLILNFHGYESNATQQEQISEMSLLADTAGFVVVYPEGLGTPQAWQTGLEGLQEVDKIFIWDLVRLLESKLSIDANRIYATGISNGAQMSIRLGCEMADLFAAIAMVSGSYPSPETCAPLRPVPLVVFHGTADQSLPFEGGALVGGFLPPARDGAVEWAGRNSCAASPEIIYQNGDVTGETWSHCQENSDVTFYTIQEGGHTWPGSSIAGTNSAQIFDGATQDIEASQAIWEFFKSHPQP